MPYIYLIFKEKRENDLMVVCTFSINSLLGNCCLSASLFLLTVVENS